MGNTSLQDPLLQVATGLPLQEKSLSLGVHTILNLGDSALTPSQQLNSKPISVLSNLLFIKHPLYSKMVPVKTTCANSKSVDSSTCYSKQFEEGDKGVPDICYTSPTSISCWLPVSKDPLPSIMPIPYSIHCCLLAGRVRSSLV